MADDLLSLLLGAGAAMAGTAAAYLQWRSHVKQVKIDLLESELIRKGQEIEELKTRRDLRIEDLTNSNLALREFVSGSKFDETIDTNVFILGPMAAGKTSLVTTLTQFWRDIRTLRPTFLFDNFSYRFPEALKKPAHKGFLGFKLDVHEHAQFLIRDFGGEAHALEQALKQLTGLTKDCILILVLTSEPDKIRVNYEYYSYTFLKNFRSCLERVELTKILRIFVIFSKSDLAPPDAIGLKRQKELNIRSMENIESLFGQNISAYQVSAMEGDGMLPFMRELASLVVDDRGLPKDPKAKK